MQKLKGQTSKMRTDQSLTNKEMVLLAGLIWHYALYTLHDAPCTLYYYVDCTESETKMQTMQNMQNVQKIVSINNILPTTLIDNSLLSTFVLTPFVLKFSAIIKKIPQPWVTWVARFCMSGSREKLI